MLTSTNEAHKVTNDVKENQKHAEYILLNYDKVLKEYKEAKAQYLSLNHNDGGVGGTDRHASITEMTALKEIEFNSQYYNYKWLKAVEIVQRSLSERKNIFISIRRAAEKSGNKTKGRRAWVIYTQQKYREAIEKRFIAKSWLSESTIRIWWYNIVNKTVLIASQIK